MDDMNKKYRRAGVAVVCYVIAAILLIFTCYTAGSTVAQINEYYAAYGMSAQPMEYVTYVSQSALQYLMYAIVVFMLGYILDAVRKTDPQNYMTDEEVAEAKIAKKEAREAKKIAKGEKAAAKAALAASEEQSVAEDFANDLDKELKADEQKSEAKKSGGNRKNYNQNRNGNNHRQQGNRSGGNRNGNRRNNDQNGNRNNQNKPKNEEPKNEVKKAADNQEKPDAQFEVTISGDE